MSRAGRGRTLGALSLLAAALPVNLAVTGVVAVRGAFLRGQRAVPSGPRRTVLVTGGKMTKALILCRAFHAAGHRVVLVESDRYRLTGHRFSRAVDVFRTIPQASMGVEEEYTEALRRIVIDEGVDVFVPVCSPASSVPDARAKKTLEQYCEVLHPDDDQVERVDDKYAFARSAEAVGLSVPDTHLITDPAQVHDFDFTAPERRGRTYVLKSIAYDPVHRLDLTRLPMDDPDGLGAWLSNKPISPDNPWILQEYVAGREFCTHGTAREGRLSVYLCCDSSAFQVNYEMVDKPEIYAWVQRYVAAYGLTGQLSFDFIERSDGSVLAIECNPRTHSAITLLDGHPDLADAYLAEASIDRPAPRARATYWVYHEVWRMLSDPRRIPEIRRGLHAGRDAILSPGDPLPFLLVHHLQIPALLLRSLRHDEDWLRIDFNIGKIVTAGGD